MDPAVANGIFKDCILGALKNKIVILVTHQLQFLRKSAQILIIKDGKQQMKGSFDEITAQGFDVDEILSQYNSDLGDKIEKKAQEEDICILNDKLAYLMKEESNHKRELARASSLKLIESARGLMATQDKIDKDTREAEAKIP